MTRPASDHTFSADVARIYESTLVPLIFQGYAADLANRVRALAPAAVLEVACGTGVVTRALARALPACAITASDLNGAMVAHAESVGTERPVTWRQADVMHLPFDDLWFDTAVCQFGVMFFPDRIAAYREIRRVLKSGGTFLFNVWRGLEDNDFAAAVTEALTLRYPDDPPLFVARTPHGHGSTAEIAREITAAGFIDCLLDRRDDISRAADARSAAVAYCHGTPLRNEIESREPGGLEAATAAVSDALRQHYGSGPIEGRISAIVGSARSEPGERP